MSDGVRKVPNGVHAREISPFGIKNTGDMHHPDLGRTSDWLKQISGTTNQKHIWVVTRHQYVISALVFLTSFCGETTVGVSKCRLFSQAKATHFLPPYNKF